MTIAACYVSPEGVVLGADSTTTYQGQSGQQHYYNHAQKLFELSNAPECGTLGAVTWGLGGLQVSSHRTLLSQLADGLKKTPPKSVSEVADRWCAQFWTAYSDPACPIAPFIAQCRALESKQAHNPKAAANPAMRTKLEEEQFSALSAGLLTGFCIGGYTLPDRTPAAFEIIFKPTLSAKPAPTALRMGHAFWGAPNMIQRLIFGGDDALKESVMNSGKWTGSRSELDNLFLQHTLAHPIIPIRDAIDFVHACIYSTIKAYKFSSLSQICGGPVELAVITTDPLGSAQRMGCRNHRWRSMMRTEKTKKPTGGSRFMEEKIPDWVREMHAYHYQHGFYRPTDVLRVLGDPGKRVEVPVAEELAAAKVDPQ